MSPLLAILCVLLIAYAVVHLLIPLAHRMGIQTDNVEPELREKEVTIKKLRVIMGPILPQYGLEWQDLEAMPFESTPKRCQECRILKQARLEDLKEAVSEPQRYVERAWA